MKFFTILAALLILSSCEQNTETDKSQTPSTPTQQQSPPTTQPPETPPPTDQPPLLPVALPEVSFVYDEFVMEKTHDVHLELKLSQPSDVPVVVDVALVNGTALYKEDYLGFKDLENAIQQTVIFAPQQTHMDLSRIKIRYRGNCNVEFSAQLQKTTVQQAVINKDSTRIVIPCL